MTEKPDTIHGRLLEAVHISGYTFERAHKELKLLLKDDKWKLCGDGYNDIDEFLKSIDFSEFTKTVEQRKDIVKELADKRASQRAIANTLGVSHTTIQRDLGTNVPKEKNKSINGNELQNGNGTNVPKDILSKSGAEIIKLADRKAHVGNNTGENEWYTPQQYIESATKVMGLIDLDPASTKEANEIIQAREYYDIEKNGLKHKWCGRIWLNPPYSSELIGNFIEKLQKEIKNQNIVEATVLVNNATETKWFQPILKICNAICFPEGRIHFWNPKKETASPLQGQAILYFGNNRDSFLNEFNKYGEVLFNPKWMNGVKYTISEDINNQ